MAPAAIMIPPPRNKDLILKLHGKYGRPGGVAYLVGYNWSKGHKAPLPIVQRVINALEVLRPADVSMRNEINDLIEELETHIARHTPVPEFKLPPPVKLES